MNLPPLNNKLSITSNIESKTQPSPKHSKFDRVIEKIHSIVCNIFYFIGFPKPSAHTTSKTILKGGHGNQDSTNVNQNLQTLTGTAKTNLQESKKILEFLNHSLKEIEHALKHLNPNQSAHLKSLENKKNVLEELKTQLSQGNKIDAALAIKVIDAKLLGFLPVEFEHDLIDAVHPEDAERVADEILMQKGSEAPIFIENRISHFCDSLKNSNLNRSEQREQCITFGRDPVTRYLLCSYLQNEVGSNDSILKSLESNEFNQDGFIKACMSKDHSSDVPQLSPQAQSIIEKFEAQTEVFFIPSEKDDYILNRKLILTERQAVEQGRTAIMPRPKILLSMGVIPYLHTTENYDLLRQVNSKCLNVIPMLPMTPTKKELARGSQGVVSLLKKGGIAGKKTLLALLNIESKTTIKIDIQPRSQNIGKQNIQEYAEDKSIFYKEKLAATFTKFQEKKLDIPLGLQLSVALSNNTINYQDLPSDLQLIVVNYLQDFDYIKSQSDRPVVKIPLNMKYDPYIQNEIDLKEELECTARLSNVHGIVKQRHVVDVTSGKLQILSPFYAGGSLTAKLNSAQPIDLKTAIQWIKQIAIGIADMHENGVLHRDLAARNILLTQDGEAKIADLGLSKAVDLTVNKGAIVDPSKSSGPQRWMAPESILKTVYSPKSDVWMFGILINEILTRDVPYPDIKKSHQLVLKVMNNELNPPTFPESTPPALLELALSCLEKDPEKRPDMKTIVAKLGEILNSIHPPNNQ